MLFFLFGFKDSYISTYDNVVLENDIKGEPDVNMTLILGFGNISEPNSHLDYREEITSYRYEQFTLYFYNPSGIDSGSYFYVNSGGNTNMYYVWFDKNGDGTTDDPSISERSGIRVDISEFDGNGENTSRAEYRDATYSALITNALTDFTIQKEGEDRITVTCKLHGETDNAQNQNVDGLEVNTQENGSDDVDTYYNDIYTSRDTKARWYPSWGLLLFFVSGILDLAYRDNS